MRFKVQVVARVLEMRFFILDRLCHREELHSLELRVLHKLRVALCLSIFFLMGFEELLGRQRVFSFYAKLRELALAGDLSS